MNLQIKNFEDYKKIYQYSLEHNDEFWSQIALKKIQWRKPWKQVSSCDYKNAVIQWFVGAELNVAENCLDRHLKTSRADKTALI